MRFFHAPCRKPSCRNDHSICCEQFHLHVLLAIHFIVIILNVLSAGCAESAQTSSRNFDDAWNVEHGIGQQIDKNAAAEKYRQLKEAGDRLATARHALLQTHDEIHNPEAALSKPDAAKLFASLFEAEDQNNPQLQVTLGDLYHNGLGTSKERGKAKARYQRAAEHGDLVGMASISIEIMIDKKRSQEDQSNALKWLNTAVDARHPRAMYALGLLLVNGKDVPRDFHRGYKLLMSAAELGHSHSQYLAGVHSKNPTDTVRWLEMAAKQHNPDALLKLTTIYFQNGSPVANSKRGSECLDEALQCRDSEVHFILGLNCKLGSSMPKDLQRAVAFFRRAADLGNPGGLYYLAVHLQEGAGVQKDLQAAVAALDSAVKLGHVAATSRLAECYLSGSGVTKDQERGFSLHQKAAESNKPQAINGLAICYRDGTGVAQNGAIALSLFDLSAQQKNEFALCAIGQMYLWGNQIARDHKKAIKYFEDAAKLGDTDAMYSLGMCHSQGWGVNRSLEQAAEYYAAAASKGHRDASHNLGVCYDLGRGVPQNRIKAFEYYLLSANKGLKESQHNLGVCYRDGQGTHRDPKAAAKCFETAAEQGLKESQINLGLCYRDGFGVPQDRKQAIKWLLMADGYSAKDAEYQSNRPAVTSKFDFKKFEAQSRENDRRANEDANIRAEQMFRGR